MPLVLHRKGAACGSFYVALPKRWYGMFAEFSVAQLIFEPLCSCLRAFFVEKFLSGSISTHAQR